jgi:hypothetical protein
MDAGLKEEFFLNSPGWMEQIMALLMDAATGSCGIIFPLTTILSSTKMVK